LSRIVDTHGCGWWTSVVNIVGIKSSWDRIDTNDTRSSFHVRGQRAATDADTEFFITSFIGSDLTTVPRETRVDAQGAMMSSIAADYLTTIGINTRRERFGAALINHFFAKIATWWTGFDSIFRYCREDEDCSERKKTHL
jgi:hypothetical protein